MSSFAAKGRCLESEPSFNKFVANRRRSTARLAPPPLCIAAAPRPRMGSKLCKPRRPAAARLLRPPAAKPARLITTPCCRYSPSCCLWQAPVGRDSPPPPPCLAAAPLRRIAPQRCKPGGLLRRFLAGLRNLILVPHCGLGALGASSGGASAAETCGIRFGALGEVPPRFAAICRHRWSCNGRLRLLRRRNGSSLVVLLLINIIWRVGVTRALRRLFGLPSYFGIAANVRHGVWRFAAGTCLVLPCAILLLRANPAIASVRLACLVDVGTLGVGSCGRAFAAGAQCAGPRRFAAGGRHRRRCIGWLKLSTKRVQVNAPRPLWRLPKPLRPR